MSNTCALLIAQYCFAGVLYKLRGTLTAGCAQHWENCSMLLQQSRCRCRVMLLCTLVVQQVEADKLQVPGTKACSAVHMSVIHHLSFSDVLNACSLPARAQCMQLTSTCSMYAAYQHADQGTCLPSLGHRPRCPPRLASFCQPSLTAY